MGKHPVTLSGRPSGQRGFTSVEYAVAGGLLVVAAVGAFAALGGEMGSVFQFIIDAL